eukprot:70552-Rhodomonas_salina.4
MGDRRAVPGTNLLVMVLPPGTNLLENGGCSISYIRSGVCTSGVSTCPACPAGTFAGNLSQTACTLCPLDTYSLGTTTRGSACSAAPLPDVWY